MWNGPEDSPLWHPYLSLPSPAPRALFTRAQGAYVYDDKDNPYLDMTSSWWCNTHGHCVPRLVEALAKQAARLDHVMISPHAHPAVLELSERLVEVAGKPFGKVFFSDNGSTAVETALKIAVQFWHNRGVKGRNRFLALESAYHGDTLGAMSVSGISQFHHFFEGLMLPTYRVPVPQSYRLSEGDTPEIHLTRCLDKARVMLEKSGHEIAALIVEPLIMGAAGMFMYPPEFLDGLVALCREYGILIIFDEVFTGFGRTGTMFAYEQLECRPDLLCLSKGLTAGMLPLAATLVRESIYEAFVGGENRTFYHGHTFTGNPLGCAVALESLALFKEEKVIEGNAALVAVMAAQRERFQALPHVGEVRHRGMVWAVELVTEKATKGVFEPANGPGWKMAQRLWGKGYWIRPLHNVVYTVPPYCVTVEELQGFFDVLYQAMGDEGLYQ